MGYELDKLMKQFGVSTPGAVMYSGATVPAAPVAPTQGGDEDAYQAALTKYNVQKADYEKNLPQLQAQEAADRAAYNRYLQNYQDRVMYTPQYTDQQYYTGPSAAVRWNEQQGLGGREAVNKSINDAIAANPNMTAREARAAMDKYGITGYDVARARGTLGMWGDTPIAAPVYTPVPPVVQPSVVQPPVVQPPVVRPPVADSPVQDVNMYDGGGGGGDFSHGGSVHGMAQKYNVGGAVRRFQFGGNEGQPDTREEMPMPAVSARPGPLAEPPVTESAAVQPVRPPASAPTPVSPAATDLMSMLERYGMGESVYAPELKAARARSDAETKAFTDMIQNAMKGQSYAPDKTEMYFRLASAFGAPTKTGRFAENLSMVGKELGEYAKESRTAKKAEEAMRLQLAMEAQKIKAQSAREELTGLRTLVGEEMKDKRALLQEYIKSGRPQSEAGKAAVDAGLQQGTPEFTDFVNKYIDDKIRSGNMLKEAMVAIAAGQLALGQKKETRAEESSKKLTPQEVKLKSEAEANLGGLDDSMSALKRAYSLNPNTFDGTLASVAQRKLLEQTDPKDPRVLATREQSNLLSKGAVEKLKASFGGNPSNAEREVIFNLEGIDSKSKEERALIMKNTYRLLQARRAREQKRLNDISAGLYRETTPSAGEIE